MEGIVGSSRGLAVEMEKWEARRDLVPYPLSKAEFEEFWENDRAHRGQWREQAKALETRLNELLEPLRHVRCIHRPAYARVKSFTSMIHSAYNEHKKTTVAGEKLQWNSVMELGDIVGARVAGLNLSDVALATRS